MRREFSMKCTICGHTTMPGAMLCGPCRAALKRARYLSVQVVSPSSMMQGRPRRSRVKVAASASPLASPSPAKVLAAHTAAAALPAPAAPVPRPWLRTLGVGVVAIAALGVIAYLGQSPERDPVAGVPARVNAMNAGAAAIIAGTPAATASGRTATSVLVSSSPADDAPPATSTRTRAPRVATPAPMGRAAGTAMLSTGPGVDVYEMVPEPPRPAPLAPPPAAAPPPPPDRWQTMRDDLARCDREGGFGGFICDQRVRLDSCEGYWGRVPQCPLPPENPR